MKADASRHIAGWRFPLAVQMLAAATLCLTGCDRIASWTGGAAPRELLTSEVKRGKLLITVTEDGNLESASNVELKCEVAGGTTILWIIEDGKQVRKGDELVRLDSSTIEENVNQQRIAASKAEATKITAEKDWSAATIAVDEYLQGTFLQELQTAESNIIIAMENLRSAENIADHTRGMARKGYVTPLQLESKEFAVKRAKLDLELQETTKKVLENFTKAKTLEQLYSTRDSAQARAKSEVAAYDLEVGKLKRLEAQLKKCTIIAPQDGMVVYANDMGNSRSGQQGVKIEEGAAVREYQTIIRLPDLSKMQVKVLVHESKIDTIRTGLRARIKIQDRELQGQVISVATQPEAGNWFSGNVKEYATYVRIDGGPKDLKPGMTAIAEILVANKKDVLSVPVQCVVQKGKQYLAWVQTPTGVEARPLVLGVTNDTYIEIKDGLKEGDLVLQSPRAEVAEAREDAAEDESVDVKKAFGESKADAGAPTAEAGGKPTAEATAEAAPGGGGPGGRRPGGPGGGPGGGRGPRMRTFAELDRNKDGKLTKEEMPSEIPEQMRDAVFDSMDEDKNGYVDKKESDAAVARMRAMQPPGGGPGGPGRGGAPAQ